MNELAETSGIVGFDIDQLYEVRNFTDRIAGMIQMCVPVDKYGMRTGVRPARYFSQVGLMVNGMPQTVEFEILVNGAAPLSMAAAIEAFDACAKNAADTRAKEIESAMMQAQLQGRSVLRPQ